MKATNSGTCSSIFGEPSWPLVVAVDDAWFEGNSALSVPPLDLLFGIRQSSSLAELESACKNVDSDLTSKLANDRGDAAYLRYLVHLCTNHKFRLLLCNFEYAETRFNELNTAGKAVLWDVFYANKNDQHYGAKALVSLLRSRKLNADMFFVTGVQHTLDELKEKHTEPEWRVLDKISPILAKGRENLMRQKLEQFAQDFGGRAKRDRFQFWARPGDPYWKIVFEGRETMQPICVETTYLAVLVARPNCLVHERWLDMINEHAQSGEGKEGVQHAKEVRLFVIAEFLRRKVHDLTTPPSISSQRSMTSPDGELHHIESTDTEKDNDDGQDGSSQDSPPQRAGVVAPLPGGTHSIQPFVGNPTSLTSHVNEMIRESEDRIFSLENEMEENPFAECQEELAHEKAYLASVKQLLAGLDKKRGIPDETGGNEFKKMHQRVQKTFARARIYFSELETPTSSVISDLASHFNSALPQGRPREPMEFRYSPQLPMQWNCKSGS